MRPLLRVGSWIVGIAVLVVLAAAVFTSVRRRQEIDTVSDEQKLARTLGILRTSSPSHHKVLKVLFYGQSITRSGWHPIVVDHWRQTYPNTVFVVQNLALGGFASPALLRATEQTLDEFYPDLIVFHDYGDHRAYERIMRLLRSRTAADIIVQTDHGEELPDPPCPDGLQESWRRPAGCAGLGWLHQRLWHDEMSYHKIPALGKKYGLAVEPQRLWWRDYLLRTHVAPGSMLVDSVHPNQKGKELIAFFFNRFFDRLVADWNGQTEDTVRSIPPTAIDHSGGQEQLQFDGSRLELLSSKPLAQRPSVAIDGVQTRDIDGCYQLTRASPVRTVPDWPTVRRITLFHDRTPEEWTATITQISPDQNHFQFTVTGSVTGFDGKGSSDRDFRSNSGKIGIEAQDWMFGQAFDLTHIPLQAPVETHWAVVYLCGSAPETIDLGDGSMQYRYVLAADLPNRAHTATLALSKEDLAGTTEFRAYRPPLM